MSWKSGGLCQSHGETPGGDTEKAPVEFGPTGSPLDVSRLRSSSMEIREKGSEFLKEELHKAQKVGEGTPGEGWGVGWVAPHALVQAPVINTRSWYKHPFLVPSLVIWCQGSHIPQPPGCSHQCSKDTSRAGCKGER